MFLAFMLEDGGEAPRTGREGTEPSMAKREAESPAEDERLMEVIGNRENLWEALEQVQRNQGGAGVDGMTVHQLPDYLKRNWMLGFGGGSAASYGSSGSISSDGLRS